MLILGKEPKFFPSPQLKQLQMDAPSEKALRPVTLEEYRCFHIAGVNGSSCFPMEYFVEDRLDDGGYIRDWMASTFHASTSKKRATNLATSRK
jgi:hypothetical protein